MLYNLKMLKLAAKDFMDEKKWGIKSSNAILSLEQLEMAKPNIVIDDSKFFDKNGKEIGSKNSEYDYKTNTIYVRSSYDIEKDITKNIIHEKAHSYLVQIAKLNPYPNKYRIYPTNTLEQVAYTTQFYYCIKSGINTIEKLRNSSAEMEDFFERRYEILLKYFNFAKNKYDNEQKQILQNNYNR